MYIIFSIYVVQIFIYNMYMSGTIAMAPDKCIRAVHQKLLCVIVVAPASPTCFGCAHCRAQCFIVFMFNCAALSDFVSQIYMFVRLRQLYAI